jgi:hypothetical protein
VDNPHALEGEVSGAVYQFQEQRQPHPTVCFGVMSGLPLITIHGEDGHPIVMWNRGGEVEIPNPDRLNDAAHTFVSAVQSVLKDHFDGVGFLVRKKDVSEFLDVRPEGQFWTHNPNFATHFVRKVDANGAALGTDYEVVPVPEAMNFGGIHGS